VIFLHAKSLIEKLKLYFTLDRFPIQLIWPKISTEVSHLRLNIIKNNNLPDPFRIGTMLRAAPLTTRRKSLLRPTYLAYSYTIRRDKISISDLFNSISDKCTTNSNTVSFFGILFRSKNNRWILQKQVVSFIYALDKLTGFQDNGNERRNC